jgi:signal transduction histidine kinase
MSIIINRLLTKSKQEQLQDPQYIEINKLISDELEFLNSNLEFKHNVKKDIQLDNAIPPIFAVYSDISQSIMNILQNAIDAMYKRQEKKLTVVTQLKDRTIYVIIKDTGVGIDEKNYLKLFDPFYTTKPTRHDRNNTAPTGTGLGLATVYNLLTPYNIKIDVDSTVDVGTTFTLRLPLDQLTKKIK